VDNDVILADGGVDIGGATTSTSCRTIVDGNMRGRERA